MLAISLAVATSRTSSLPKVPIRRVVVGGAHYAIQIWKDDASWTTWPVILRNGKRIKSIQSDYYLEVSATFLDWPFKGKLLLVRAIPANAATTWYYRVDKKGVTGPMATLDSGRNGGPIYRDLDHDGRPEMIFDNYSWYLRHESPLPNKFLVYKVSRSRTMKFLKAIPNPHHKRLKDTTGLSE
jgi:hypothetical protein